MDHGQNELETANIKDFNKIENTLKIFWDKARTMAELLSRYQEHQNVQKQKQIELEKEVSKLRNEVLLKNQELKQIQAEHARLQRSDSGNVLNTEEQGKLKNRIHDLLTRINSHL